MNARLYGGRPFVLSDLAVSKADRIAKIDLNPIIALCDECLVVDALIVTRQA
jgi:hypothetical protein